MVTACPGFTTFAMGWFDRGRRETLASLREGTRHSAVGLGRPQALVIVEISGVMLAVVGCVCIGSERLGQVGQSGMLPFHAGSGSVGGRCRCVVGSRNHPLNFRGR